MHDSPKFEIIVSIKDDDKDSLFFNDSNAHFSCSTNNKSSLTITASNKINIDDVLDSLFVVGSAEDKMLLNITYNENSSTTQKESFNYEITPSITNSVITSINISNNEDPSPSFHPPLEDTPIEEVTALENDLNWGSGTLIYEETEHSDFLDSFEDEILPYKVTSTNEGDVYKILKDSFTQNNTLEILDYDVAENKIDLSEFAEDYGSSFSYSLNNNENELSLDILNHGEIAHTLILKDISIESYDMDDFINNIVINPDGTLL